MRKSLNIWSHTQAKAKFWGMLYAATISSIYIGRDLPRLHTNAIPCDVWSISTKLSPDQTITSSCKKGETNNYLFCLPRLSVPSENAKGKTRLCKRMRDPKIGPVEGLIESRIGKHCVERPGGNPSGFLPATVYRVASEIHLVAHSSHRVNSRKFVGRRQDRMKIAFLESQNKIKSVAM